MTIVVIQCANSKRPESHMLTREGKKVKFVANPAKIEDDDPDVKYAHPDDVMHKGSSKTWREKLSLDNRIRANEGSNLLAAWELYKPREDVYSFLRQRFGTNNLYILSAGWGLIRADFLTPDYDITFSAKQNTYKKRTRKIKFKDYKQLEDTGEPMVFFICPPYFELAIRLTRKIKKSPKHLFYKSEKTSKVSGFKTHKYETKRKTNWHYSCAKDFAIGNISIL